MNEKATLLEKHSSLLESGANSNSKFFSLQQEVNHLNAHEVNRLLISSHKLGRIYTANDSWNVGIISVARDLHWVVSILLIVILILHKWCD